MFKKEVNEVCNTLCLLSPTIAFMHEQMTRLYEAAKALRGISSQADLARALNMSSQTINNWEARGISKTGMLESQRLLGCSATWLATGDGPMVLTPAEPPPVPGAMRVEPINHTAPPRPSRVRIPKVVDIRLAAGLSGVSIELDRRDDGVWDVPLRWIEQNLFSPDHLYAIDVKGESMEPNYYHGDLVVINTADKRPVSGVVFAVNVDGEPAIKRLVREGGVWWLKSDNPLPRYHKISFADAKIDVIGRIVRRETEHVP